MDYPIENNKKGRSMAVAGIVFAVLALMIWWIPYFAVVPAILALIMSIIAYMQSKSSGNTAHGIVVAALVVASISVIATGYWTYKATQMAHEAVKNHPNEFEDIKEVIRDFTNKTDSADFIEENAEELEKTMEELEQEIERLAGDSTDLDKETGTSD